MKTTRTIIWSQVDTIEAIALAKLGWGDLAIQRQTGLTAGKISYRLRQSSIVEKLEKGMGYRRQWRLGNSPWTKAVVNTLLPRVRKDIRTNILPLAVRPAAEITEGETTAPPTVDQAVETLKKRKT